MRLLLAILVVAVVPLLLQEFGTVAPWLAERLVRWATRWLPPHNRERFESDWLGELGALPGQIIKLVFAFHILMRVPALRRALTGRPGWVELSRQVLAMLITLLLATLRLLTRFENRPPNRGGLNEKWRRAEAADAIGIGGIEVRFVRPNRLLSPTSPLERTSLHPRTVRTLQRAGIHTFGQLVQRFADSGEAGMLGHIRDFGRRDMNEVLRVLEQDPVDPTRGTGL